MCVVECCLVQTTCTSSTTHKTRLRTSRREKWQRRRPTTRLRRKSPRKPDLWTKPGNQKVCVANVHKFQDWSWAKGSDEFCLLLWPIQISCSSQEPLDQFQPNLAQSILGWRGFKFVQVNFLWQLPLIVVNMDWLLAIFYLSGLWNGNMSGDLILLHALSPGFLQTEKMSWY